MPKYYPICVDLTGKPCLVVGGGDVAQRKVEGLLRAGGRVHVVSPAANAALRQWARAGKIRLFKRAFRPHDIAGCAVVIGATDDKEVQKKIFVLCRKKRILVNVVDMPTLCSFIVPSVVRRGRLTIAISTNGASPGFSKKIRRQLEGQYGKEHSVFLDWMEKARPKLARKLPTQQQRKAVFEHLIESPVLDLLAKGRKEEAKRLFEKIISSSVGRRTTNNGRQ